MRIENFPETYRCDDCGVHVHVRIIFDDNSKTVSLCWNCWHKMERMMYKMEMGR